MTTDRREQLALALAGVQVRIERACAAAGRPAAEVALLPVTKGKPATDVALLEELGVTTVGENRVQEAQRKIAELDELRPGTKVAWHLVGRLQRNKVRAAVGWAARIDTIDSEPLARAVDAAVRRAVDAGSRTDPMPVLVQLSLDGDPHRGGIGGGGLAALADLVAGSAGLRLDGLMAIAPLHADPDRAFAALAAAAVRLRGAHPDARELSAGMSADLEAAIRHGSTQVRVGTALLGQRPLASEQAISDQRSDRGG